MKVPLTCSCRLSLSLSTKTLRGIGFGLILLTQSAVNFIALAADNPIRLRLDLQSTIQTMICDHNLLPSHYRLWQKRVYDTMFEGQVVRAKNFGVLTKRGLALAARRLAARKGHKGAVYGKCSEEKGWIVAVASPFPLVEISKSKVSLAMGAAKSYCRYGRVDFAPAGMGRPTRLWSTRNEQQLNIVTVDLNSYFLGSGTISITCRQGGYRRGNELWALIPIGQPDTRPPDEQLLGSEMTTLDRWVNSIRRSHGLPTLTRGLQALEQTGQKLIENSGVRHDKVALSHEKARLKKLAIDFIGENRVHGKTTKDMAWLLWNSPRHRSLLLNPKATHIAHVYRRVTAQKYLSVLVVASSETISK